MTVKELRTTLGEYHDDTPVRVLAACCRHPHEIRGVHDEDDERKPEPSASTREIVVVIDGRE